MGDGSSDDMTSVSAEEPSHLSLSLSLSLSRDPRGWIGMALIESELFFSRPRRAAPRLLKGSRRRAAAAAAAVDSLKRGRKTRGIS